MIISSFAELLGLGLLVIILNFFLNINSVVFKKLKIMTFKKKKIFFLFFYLVFLIFWLSIGSTPSYLINFNSNIKEILNFFLIYTPLLISILILIPLVVKNIINNIKSRNLYKLQNLFFFLSFPL